MKSAKKLSLMSFALLMFVASQFAMTASSRLVTPQSGMPQVALPQSPYQAIIVIRHGQDRKKEDLVNTPSSDYWNDISPAWPKYTLSNNRPLYNQRIGSNGLPTDSVTVLTGAGHRLNETGEFQAKRLQADPSELEKVDLLKILTSATPAQQMGPFAPVTRAITIDPSTSSSNYEQATSNPFATIYPFLKEDSTFTSKNTVDNRNLLLINTKTAKTVSPKSLIELSTPPSKSTLIVADGLQEMINNDTLLPSDGGSTLLCWDGEGMWGEEKTQYRMPGSTDAAPVYEERRVFNPNSILAQLAGNIVANQFNIPEFYHDFYPAKGAVIYIFTRAIFSNTKYNLTIYSSAWTEGQTSGLGVLTWRGTWNSNHSGWPEGDDRYLPVSTNRVVAGADQMIVRD
jgi:hypothetical protein